MEISSREFDQYSFLEKQKYFKLYWEKGEGIISDEIIGYDERRIKYTQPYYKLISGIVRAEGVTNVVEIGTHKGGSTLAFEAGLSTGKGGQIITIDTVDHLLARDRLSNRANIARIIGDSEDESVQQQVRDRFCKFGKTLLYIDGLKDGSWIERNIEIYNFINPDLILLDDITINFNMLKWWDVFSSNDKYYCYNIVDYLGRNCRNDNLTELNCGFGLCFVEKD